MSYQCISVEQAEKLLEVEGAVLLDVRDPISFSQGSISDAIHLTNGNVEDVIAGADKSKPLIIYCYHGNSSKGVADYFFKQGFEQSYSVDGGYEEWR